MTALHQCPRAEDSACRSTPVERFASASEGALELQPTKLSSSVRFRMNNKRWRPVSAYPERFDVRELVHDVVLFRAMP